jgi:hypothetical protein
LVFFLRKAIPFLRSRAGHAAATDAEAIKQAGHDRDCELIGLDSGQRKRAIILKGIFYEFDCDRTDAFFD